MVYLNYLSKTRNKIGMTPEELQKEIEYNKGRIATKVLPNANRIKYNSKTNDILCNLNNFVYAMNINYPDISGMYRTFQIPKRSEHAGGGKELSSFSLSVT